MSDTETNEPMVLWGYTSPSERGRGVPFDSVVIGEPKADGPAHARKLPVYVKLKEALEKGFVVAPDGRLARKAAEERGATRREAPAARC